jgi:hypothetical protein
MCCDKRCSATVKLVGYIGTRTPDNKIRSNYSSPDDGKIEYNKTFSASRVKIENAFCLLKARWGQLRYIRFFTVEKMSLFICIDCQDQRTEDEKIRKIFAQQ